MTRRLRPPPVRPGATVGVAALSGVVDPARLERGLAGLRELGFEVREAPNLRASWQGFAGTDEEPFIAKNKVWFDEHTNEQIEAARLTAG